MMTEQHIAKIEWTFIGFEDHGLLSASLTFNYGGASQGIGHRIFGSMNEKNSEQWRTGHEMGMDFIRRVLLACGVDKWENLRGRTVLVTASHTEITRIDPLPTEQGEPFDIKEWADSFYVEEPVLGADSRG